MTDRVVPFGPSLEVDRISDPLDPCAPHIRILRTGDQQSIELVPYYGRPVKIVVDDASSIAREIYGFAEELARYRDATCRDLKHAQLESTISDLEDALDLALYHQRTAIRMAADDEVRADRFQSITEQIIDKLESLVASDSAVGDLQRRLQTLVEQARAKERDASDGLEKDNDRED